MLVYDGSKIDFLMRVEEDTIAYEIEKNIYEKMNRVSSKSEFRSWENSLEYMYKVLNDPEIPNNCGIAIEYNIPQTSKRVDFLISGFDNNKIGNIFIIELKQWDSIKSIQGKDGLVETYTGGGIRQVVHPSYQAWSYSMLIKDFNTLVQREEIQLIPCAYLHNYRRKKDDPIDEPQYKAYYKDAPIFSRGEVIKLRNFIKEKIVMGDSDKLIYQIDSAKIKPSKSLQNTIASMMKGNKEFYLIDEQKVVFEDILNISKQCQKDYKKRVMIVEGGPGTGKTVVAINILAQLTQEGYLCQYVSKNSAPRNVYLSKLKGNFKKSTVENLFKGSGTYTDVESNRIDILLIDEAHRLNEKSGMFQNIGENQIKEIINASLCSIFFIDEKQKVTLKDIGSVIEIEKWAKYYGAEIYKQELSSQFRCDGSDGYLAWLDNTLQIRETANFSMEEIDYQFEVVDSPLILKKIIDEKYNNGKTARLLAGYCWEWIKDGKNNTEIYDIIIDDFKMSWNLANTTTYAIDDSSINEVGCIHTSQGLEFEYVGVIIGNDLRYENGKIITDFTKRAKTDQSLRGIKKLYKENPDKAKKEADEIIKNTYRTLLTRGMKGCFVYCVDQGLQEYLKEKIYETKY